MFSVRFERFLPHFWFRGKFGRLLVVALLILLLAVAGGLISLWGDWETPTPGYVRPMLGLMVLGALVSIATSQFQRNLWRRYKPRRARIAQLQIAR